MTPFDAAAAGPAGPPATHVRLRPIDAGGTVPPLVLDRPVYVVGSRPGVHLLLPSPVVSRTHALLVRDDRGGLYVRDLASRNRVYVNDQPVREAALVDGDRLRLGPFEFACQAAGTEPAPAGLADGPPGADDPGPAELRVEGASAVPFNDRRTLLVGTRPGCDVRLPGPGVAVAHAVVYRRAGRRFVRDMCPTASLRVDGQLVREAELLGGEQIVVGAHLLWYVRTGAVGARTTRPRVAGRLAGLVGPDAAAARGPSPAGPPVAGAAGDFDGDATAPGGLAGGTGDPARAGPPAQAGTPVLAGGSTPSDGWPWLLTAADPEPAGDGNPLHDPHQASPGEPVDRFGAGAAGSRAAASIPVGGRDLPGWAAFVAEARPEDLELSDLPPAPVIDLWGSSHIRLDDPHQSRSLSVHPDAAADVAAAVVGVLPAPTAYPGSAEPSASADPTALTDPFARVEERSGDAADPHRGDRPTAPVAAAGWATCPCCGTRFALSAGG